MNTINERLKAERVRVGLTQEELALRGGVQRRAQANYESGDRNPDAAYLQGVEAAGLDVLYIVTGKHSVSEEDIANRLGILSDAWQAIDEALSAARKTMPADKKRLAAEALYQAVNAGEGEAASLAKLITKAA